MKLQYHQIILVLFIGTVLLLTACSKSITPSPQMDAETPSADEIAKKADGAMTDGSKDVANADKTTHDDAKIENAKPDDIVYNPSYKNRPSDKDFLNEKKIAIDGKTTHMLAVAPVITENPELFGSTIHFEDSAIAPAVVNMLLDTDMRGDLYLYRTL